MAPFVRLDLVVINAAFLFTIGWTFLYDTEGSGAQAHLRAVAAGIILVDVVLVAAARWHAARARARMVRSTTTGTAGGP